MPIIRLNLGLESFSEECIEEYLEMGFPTCFGSSLRKNLLEHSA